MIDLKGLLLLQRVLLLKHTLSDLCFNFASSFLWPGRSLQDLVTEYFNSAGMKEDHPESEQRRDKEEEKTMDVLSKSTISYVRTDIKVFLSRFGSQVSPIWPHNHNSALPHPPPSIL